MKTTIRKGFKFRLEPNDHQRDQLTLFAGHARFVWNKALRMNLWRLEHGYRIMRYTEMCHWLKPWKQSDEYGFLRQAHSQVLQQSLKHLDRAFADAFDRKQPLKRMPRFKRKSDHADSITWPQGFKVDGNRIFLPRIGWVRFRKSREIEGIAKNVTASSYEAGHWYVSIQTEMAVELPQHPAATSAIGVDVGVAHTLTLSDGTHLDLPQSILKLEEKLARLQKQLSRRVRFSSNWRKLKLKIARLHRRIANIRRDFLHKASTALSKSHALVAVENLRVKDMTRSAKGTVDNPGRNVKAKSGLNRSILRQGWSMFVAMLEYKLAWHGGMLVKVAPQHTSQTCPVCEHVDAANRRTQAQFVCVRCGHEQNADVVGAINVLTRGLRGLACGSNRVSGRKQEPAGSSDACPLPLLA